MFNQYPDGAYRYSATSVPGLIQQLVLYLSKGYWFYVSGYVPEGKEPDQVAEKLIKRYEVNPSKFVRARRKRQGFYNVQFIMHDSRWWLLSTHGRHPKDKPMEPFPDGFFRAERPKDVRKEPLKAFGYSITAGNGVKVRIEREQFALIRDFMLEQATRRQSLWHEFQIYSLPFEPYGPVRAQLGRIVNGINEKRRKCGFDRVRKKCVRYKINRVKPFEPLNNEEGQNQALGN